MKKVIYTILFLLILIVPLSIVLINNRKTDTDLKPVDSNINWYYLDENNNKINVNFPLDMDRTKNEVSTIYAEVPTNLEYVNTLFFRSIYQYVEIKVDDEVIYQYNETTNKKFGISMPRKLNIVHLPEGINGKTISISISSPYYKYSGYFSNAEIGESTEVINNIYGKYSLSLILSIVLIFLNLSFMFANSFLYKVKITTPSVFYIFLSGLFVGLWLLCDSKLITFFISNNITNNLMYVFLICFIILVAIFLKKTYQDKYKVSSTILLYLAIINMLVQYVLHFSNILTFVHLMPISLLIIFILFIFYLIYIFKDIKYIKKEKNKLDLLNVVEFVMSFVICILTLVNVLIQNLGNYNMNGIIGAFYFMFIMVIYAKTIILVLRKAERSRVYKARLKETQNYLMQSQMKPHFIFNTLSAIRTLIMSNPKVAYEMTTNFSKYLRANISTIEPGEKISFAQELDHIKAYVAIERERFKNRIMVVYDIECDNFYLPPLSVEPLVENAIKHGICKKVSGGTVKISSKEYDDRYEVIVEDDGVGFDTTILETSDNTKSVGLKYIILRLKQVSDADFEITSEKGKGTKAVITVKK